MSNPADNRVIAETLTDEILNAGEGQFLRAIVTNEIKKALDAKDRKADILVKRLLMELDYWKLVYQHEVDSSEDCSASMFVEEKVSLIEEALEQFRRSE